MIYQQASCHVPTVTEKDEPIASHFCLFVSRICLLASQFLFYCLAFFCLVPRTFVSSSRTFCLLASDFLSPNLALFVSSHRTFVSSHRTFVYSFRTFCFYIIVMFSIFAARCSHLPASWGVNGITMESVRGHWKATANGERRGEWGSLVNVRRAVSYYFFQCSLFKVRYSMFTAPFAAHRAVRRVNPHSPDRFQ